MFFFDIDPLKNKQQLVKALGKSAGEELAEKTKKKVLEVGYKEGKRVVRHSASSIIPKRYSSKTLPVDLA
ncbi:MAG: hypothetical protein QMD10_09050 [Desulfitobacteriaceae bacterium]|nr:hypothetical protein [Desulfitobacteriaceae bacterium]